MIFRPTDLEGVVVIDIEPRGDERGFLGRTYCRNEFDAAGISMPIAQCSTVLSPKRGTMRGLHYQEHPHWETKLIRCTAGSAWVAAVDLRPRSRTYRRWFGVTLSADNRRALHVPEGFAQGYQTLADETELYYQMSREYVPAAARGVRCDDPALAIEWPTLPPIVMSERDRSWPPLRQ